MSLSPVLRTILAAGLTLGAATYHANAQQASPRTPNTSQTTQCDISLGRLDSHNQEQALENYRIGQWLSQHYQSDTHSICSYDTDDDGSLSHDELLSMDRGELEDSVRSVLRSDFTATTTSLVGKDSLINAFTWEDAGPYVVAVETMDDDVLKDGRLEHMGRFETGSVSEGYACSMVTVASQHDARTGSRKDAAPQSLDYVLNRTDLQTGMRGANQDISKTIPRRVSSTLGCDL